MSNKLRLQITEKYIRDVFIDVIVPEDKLDFFNWVLDKHEDSYNDYEALIYKLSNEGFKVLHIDDNNDLFGFEETCDIDYSFINEEVNDWKECYKEDAEQQRTM